MKKHPILNLYCNQDGSVIKFNDKELHVSYTTRNNVKQSGTVSINGKKRAVATVICECYYGMRPDKSFFPVRADNDVTNNHYKNLSWGKRRGKQKITLEVLKDLHQDFANQNSVKKLAEVYKVSEQTIRIYKRAWLKTSCNNPNNKK